MQGYSPVVVRPDRSRRKLSVTLVAMAMAGLVVLAVSRSGPSASKLAETGAIEVRLGGSGARTQSLQSVETYRVTAHTTDDADELQAWADGPGGMQHFLTVFKQVHQPGR